MSKGAERIARERLRQIEEEGWTPEHDVAEHPAGDLASAALCYLLFDEGEPEDSRKIQNRWPFAPYWFKPKDRIRNLERAGALIAAEIDRALDEPSI